MFGSRPTLLKHCSSNLTKFSRNLYIDAFVKKPSNYSFEKAVVTRYLKNCNDRSLYIGNACRRMSSSNMYGLNHVLSNYDDTQVQYLDEPCILVNKNDEVVGTESKKTCHLLENIENGMLHRAFSVFLFNMEGKLLLQQRSDAKITYPGLYTNTCCSHPLSKYHLETEEKKAIGVKRAAQRKLKHELGISPDQIPLDAFVYITRIMYKADNIPSDGIFGEQEIDYILFIKGDVSLSVNKNEVKDYRFVDKNELNDLLERNKETCILTPWFRMISETFLTTWWKAMLKGKMDSVRDWKKIHSLF